MAEPGIQNECKLVVCTPIPVVRNAQGNPRLAPITMQWHRARMQMTIPFGYNALELKADGYEVGEARNEVVRVCRERRAEWLLFIDYDVLVPMNAFKRLMYRATVTHKEYDIFAGVYCAKEHPTIPIIYKRWNEGAFWDWKVGDVIEDVVGVPMGCTLLRLSLFDRLTNTVEKPWFKTHDLSEGNPLDVMPTGIEVVGTVTEDLWFCKRAVEEAKCRILVDTSVQCGHIDNGTGEVFTLPEDSPAGRELKIRRGTVRTDIETHLPYLTSYAGKSDVVVEFGVRDGHSTRALLAGSPGRLVSYDIIPCPAVDDIRQANYQFIQGNAEEVDIPVCDLLLVDSRHTGEHVRRVIERHKDKVRKWIAFHDTVTYGTRGENGGEGIMAPIQELLRDWKGVYSSDEDNGMLILERPDNFVLPEDSPPVRDVAKLNKTQAGA